VGVGEGDGLVCESRLWASQGAMVGDWW
jgi:hypothetical protein